MPVFDQTTKVPRAVPDPKRDRSMPPAGALSWGAITSPTALAGTSGIDVKLIHGDQWEVIVGNVFTFVSLNRNCTVGQNQTTLVRENRSDTTAGNRSNTTIGSSNRTQIGPTNDTYVAPQNCTHASNQNRDEPTSFLHRISNWFLNTQSWDNHGSVYFQAYATYLSFVGVYVDVKAANGAFTGVNASFMPINLHAEIIDNGTRALKNDIAGLKSSIEAIQPEVSITMVHAVAITQKILIIGINQFM